MPLSSFSKALPSQSEGQRTCHDLRDLLDWALRFSSVLICDSLPVFTVFYPLFSFLFLEHIGHIICFGLCSYSYLSLSILPLDVHTVCSLTSSWFLIKIHLLRKLYLKCRQSLTGISYPLFLCSSLAVCTK